MAAVVAVFRERGPAHPRCVRDVLTHENRIRYSTTMADVYSAACLLAAEGTVEHVRRAGAIGGGYFRVPGDSRERWDKS
jgi:hypothetical protein